MQEKTTLHLHAVDKRQDYPTTEQDIYCSLLVILFHSMQTQGSLFVYFDPPLFPHFLQSFPTWNEFLPKKFSLIPVVLFLGRGGVEVQKLNNEQKDNYSPTPKTPNQLTFKVSWKNS